MPLTALEMVNQAEAELGLPQSASAYTSSADNSGMQMGALANRVIDELRRMGRWTAMQFEYNLIVQPPTDTTGNLAAQSAVITKIPATAGLQPNYWQVTGPGISQAARIKSVDSPTQVTMDMENTNTA